MNCRIIEFQQHGDERGSLVAAEFGKELPFEIKRVYYIYGVGEGVRRGFHAHKELNQLLIAIKGSCSILLDDGESKKVVLLNSPTKGLIVAPGVWHEMFDFSPDAVLISLASEKYDESDYIRNYDVFLEYVGRKKQ